MGASSAPFVPTGLPKRPGSLRIAFHISNKSDKGTVSKTLKELNEAQRKHLKRLAHHRRAIVQTGANGLTDAVLTEVDRGLHDHELIKVRLVANDREERGAMIAEIRERTGAILVQRIGHVAVLYRAHPDKPAIELPGQSVKRKAAHS
jgi:RNA-binding protein